MLHSLARNSSFINLLFSHVTLNIVDCPIVSLHEVFLYDMPLKLTLDHTQWVFLVILY